MMIFIELCVVVEYIFVLFLAILDIQEKFDNIPLRI